MTHLFILTRGFTVESLNKETLWDQAICLLVVFFFFLNRELVLWRLKNYLQCRTVSASDLEKFEKDVLYPDSPLSRFHCTCILNSQTHTAHLELVSQSLSALSLLLQLLDEVFHPLCVSLCGRLKLVATDHSLLLQLELEVVHLSGGRGK